MRKQICIHSKNSQCQVYRFVPHPLVQGSLFSDHTLLLRFDLFCVNATRFCTITSCSFSRLTLITITMMAEVVSILAFLRPGYIWYLYFWKTTPIYTFFAQIGLTETKTPKRNISFNFQLIILYSIFMKFLFCKFTYLTN